MFRMIPADFSTEVKQEGEQMIRILAVDDASTMRSFVKVALEEKGFEVLTAVDGVHALKVIESQEIPFDLVITDLNMPNKTGMSLISDIRRLDLYQATPILVLTTESDEMKKSKSKNVGANGWITKPFEPGRLINAVETLLERVGKL